LWTVPRRITKSTFCSRVTSATGLPVTAMMSASLPGSIGPMSLVSYQDARPWARSIKQRVESRQMPPWHIDRTIGIQEFKNDGGLSDEQIATIVNWVDGGTPLGDPKDMPPAITFPDPNRWQLADSLGTPDVPEVHMAIHDESFRYAMVATVSS
jgi:hypothetical protein